eukprot:496855-Pyramimonas_sp.AAC.1
MMRRYESRRDKSGVRRALADDVKFSSLEAMLPEELESHVQLNKARITTFDELREEVVSYAELRSEKKVKPSKPSKPEKDDNAMDVDALGGHLAALWRQGRGAGGGRGSGGPRGKGRGGQNYWDKSGGKKGDKG